jgi:drug/metabolite transporter (DMT)-like permease
VAIGGLVFLVAPGVTAPSPVGSLFMATAGAAWGFYSVRGRGAPDPIAATAGNFARSVLMVAVLAVVMVPSVALTQRGLLLAVLSGAVASGLGYVLWYMALRGLSTTEASIVQLAVPVMVAWVGVVLLSEDLTARLILSGSAILGGIALAVTTGRPRTLVDQDPGGFGFGALPTQEDGRNGQAAAGGLPSGVDSGTGTSDWTD